MYFLEHTYASKSRFDAQAKDTQKQIHDTIDLLLVKLGMHETERRYPGLDWITFWYFQYFLAPTVFLVEQYKQKVLGGFLICIIGCMGYTSKCFLHLNPEPHELHTFERLQHSPMSGIVLLLCTHFICSTFAYFNLMKLRSGETLLLPLGFSLFVGKVFMAGRMVLAYSSANMGIALDYFVWQEIILTGCHAFGSMVSVGYPDQNQKEFPREIRDCMFRVLRVDAGKTIVIAIFWWNFQPTGLTTLIDRMPDQDSQIVFAVVVHFVMDMMQSAVTFFTIYLGKLGQCGSKKREKDTPLLA